MIKLEREVIGLIPAGGHGARIGPLPCSKEIYPIGFDESNERRPKVICHYLLEKMRFAGIDKCYIILRDGKWDIPAYLGDGKMVGMDLAYLMMGAPFGVPFTIDQAFPFVKDATIAFGFPDIFFESDDVFVGLLDKLRHDDCDVVVGLFPSDRPQKADMVDVSAGGRIRNIVIKPERTDLRYTWGVAVWSPVFTEFIHHYVKRREPFAGNQTEVFVGEVVQKGIEKGLHVEAIHIADKPFIDIGTPDDMFRAAKLFIDRPRKNRL